jgi:hypothetical protein
MKIIDAIWEKRNIGLDTREVEVSEDDSWVDLEDAIKKIDCQYLVVKIPCSRTDLTIKVNELGLVFVELLTKAHFTGPQPELSGIQRRVFSSLTWGKMTSANKEILFKEISLGMFKTDRVAIDPLLGIERSSNRYLGWIADELNSGALMYEITKGKELVGFFLIRKENSNSSNAILAGLLDKYQKSGFGFVLNHLQIEISNEMGCTSVYSTFSSNNRGATAVHMSMGYTLDHQHYVYVMHPPSKIM